MDWLTYIVIHIKLLISIAVLGGVAYGVVRLIKYFKSE